MPLTRHLKSPETIPGSKSQKPEEFRRSAGGHALSRNFSPNNSAAKAEITFCKDKIMEPSSKSERPQKFRRSAGDYALEIAAAKAELASWEVKIVQPTNVLKLPINKMMFNLSDNAHLLCD